MEKWFADHVEELSKDFEWKKKLETKEIIKNDDYDDNIVKQLLEKIVIVNENNTTVINQTNIKHINKTANDEPKKEDAIQQLVKTVGNPIFLLLLVIVIAAIVAVVMHRKG